MSCSSGDNGALPIRRITPTASTSGAVVPGGDVISICGKDGCSPIKLPGESQCDGGAAVTILGFKDRRNLLGARRVQGTGASSDECNQVIDWGGSDASPPPVFVPPTKEDFACPAGTIRIHIRDVWSKAAEPSLKTLENRPLGVSLINEQWSALGARADSANCDWYSVCAPSKAYQRFKISPMADSCAKTEGISGDFDLSSLSSATEVWLDYTGTSATISSHYGSATVNPGAFRLTSNKADVADELCPEGAPPGGPIEGYTRLHIRYPWGDPAKTGFQGSACEDERIGSTSPPYPSTLKINWSSDTKSCDAAMAMLDLQNSHCPWYTLYIANSDWTNSDLAVKIAYPNAGAPLLETGPLKLPAPRTQDEYWLAYTGPTDDVAWSDQGTPCMNWSTRPDSMHFFQENPGPGYAGCGGDSDVKVDPCSPPTPSGYHSVHFRYIWAGQKIFTFFPALDLMPRWIVMEVTPDNSSGPKLDAVNITCTREADRPWFNCQVPDAYFRPGTKWRAVDKTNIGVTEWNTVEPRPFPTEPKEWWIRWYYGKPDYNGDFKAFDYYPDGVGGDWSATGVWNDQDCAPKPPVSPVQVGFGGWFPYDETGYVYPFGSSLSIAYPAPKVVQPLFNYLVQERYLIWKENYIRYDADACGVGTARVHTDPPNTVSEGQGYGIAIAAAIGDKELFEKLWRFTRHYLSQSSKKYCGGLMGWMWDGPQDCRPLDKPCDPDKDGCGGNDDSAFDGDVDIAIGLVYAGMQWPEYRQAAVSWLLKMECELNAAYEPPWIFGGKGDTADKNCAQYEKGNPNSKPCTFGSGVNGATFVNYYPPGYFRVFGDYLQKFLSPKLYSEEQRSAHRSLWYKAAESVYEQLERCYDQSGVHPALTSDNGTWSAPCSSQVDNYNWARYLWRVGVDAAWFGNRTDIPENQPGSSRHYPTKSRMQAKIDNIQDFFSNFYLKNPVEPNANRFSSICQNLTPDGAVEGCDPAFGHNSYFVGTMASAFVSVFDNAGKTTGGIRREAIEEAISTAIMNDKYYQESIGVYTLLFLTGNFPNPLTVTSK